MREGAKSGNSKIDGKPQLSTRQIVINGTENADVKMINSVT